MSSPDFVFSLRLAGRPDTQMIGELTASVLKFVGSPAAAAEIVEGLTSAAQKGSETDGYDVQFKAHGGELEIAMLRSGQPVWRTSRRLA